jgi:hypothetical protein
LSVVSSNRAEVTLICGEDIEAPVPFGQYDARSVGQVKGGQVCIAGAKSSCPGKVLIGESVYLVGSLYLFDSGQLSLATIASQNQMIQFGENQRRDKKRTAGRPDRFEKPFVVVLIAIEDRRPPVSTVSVTDRGC